MIFFLLFIFCCDSCCVLYGVDVFSETACYVIFFLHIYSLSFFLVVRVCVLCCAVQINRTPQILEVTTFFFFFCSWLIPMSSDGRNCLEDSKCSFEEDLRPKRRRVSFSSDDSEPILKCFRCDSPSLSSSDDGLEDSRARYLYGPLEDVEIEEENLMVPLDQVSEAPIVAVSSISAKESSYVVEINAASYAVDVGTHLCLDDGTYAGTVVSVFGPVQKAFCLVKIQAANHFSTLLEKGKLHLSAPLHYDLMRQKILFCPELQCDTAAGTDASYLHDEELPDNVRPEFSDDEKERLWVEENRELGSVHEVNESHSCVEE